MQLGGNWTTDGVLMTTSKYNDMRSAGNWYSPSIEDLSNTTGWHHYYQGNLTEKEGALHSTSLHLMI
jgi:hypothetical protein